MFQLNKQNLLLGQGKPDILNLLIANTKAAMAKAVSEHVIASIKEKPYLVICLPTGNTPRLLYSCLRDAHNMERVDFSEVRIVMVDEYVGASPTDSWSFSAYLNRELIAPLNICPQNILHLNGCADDPENEAHRHEEAIAAVGGIDIAVLGLGANGHIAFNEPGSSPCGTSHVAALSSQTLAANAADLPACPKLNYAITIDLGSIQTARQVLLLISGTEKRDAFAALINHADPLLWPVAVLCDHPRLSVITTADLLFPIFKQANEG